MPTNRAQHATAPQAAIVGPPVSPMRSATGRSGNAWRRRLVPCRESLVSRWIIAAVVLALVGAASAQPGEWADVPPPPEMAADAPPPVLDERARQLQMLEEADITLIERPDGIIREYRIGGRLFMVEVVPRFGPRYYLIDTNGDGMLDTQRRGLGPDFVPPQWILFQW
jgi:hypothetical protein